MTESVSVEESTFEMLEKRAVEKGFDSTQDYIRHLLDQVVEKINKEKNKQDEYNDEEAEKVKEKLKDLGYMD